MDLSSVQAPWRLKAGWWMLMAGGFAFGVALAAALSSRSTALRAEAALRELARKPPVTLDAVGNQPREFKPEVDFTHDLPQARETATHVAQMKRLARANGVILVGLSARQAASGSAKLGRLELSVHLRGTYAGIKAVVGSVTVEHGVVLNRLVMRRGSVPMELEAHADWTLLSRPIGPAGG